MRHNHEGGLTNTFIDEQGHIVEGQGFMVYDDAGTVKDMARAEQISVEHLMGIFDALNERAARHYAQHGGGVCPACNRLGLVSGVCLLCGYKHDHGQTPQ